MQTSRSSEILVLIEDPSTEVDVPPARRSCSTLAWAVLRQQKALAAVILAFVVAYPKPGPASALYPHVSSILLVALFGIVGSTVDVSTLSKGICAMHVHALIQSYNLLIMPLLYYFAVYRWGWERRQPHILTDELAIGTMAALCMPTTANTCVLFTKQAGGDDAVAVFNATCGNILGIFVAPFMAHICIGGYSSDQSSPLQVLNLCCEEILPFAVGVGMQSVAKCFSPRVHDIFNKTAKCLSNIVMLIVFYFIWCSVLVSGSQGLQISSAVRLVLWIGAVHITFMFGAWALGAGLQTKRRIAFVLTAPQKTEGMAIAILAVIFKGAQNPGLYALPVMVYHTIQMTVAAVLVDYFSRIVECEVATANAAQQSNQIMDPQAKASEVS